MLIDSSINQFHFQYLLFLLFILYNYSFKIGIIIPSYEIILINVNFHLVSCIDVSKFNFD